MREPRIYVDQPLTIGMSIALDVRAAHHLRMVLRLRDGAVVKLFNGNGQEYSGELVAVRQNHTLIHLNSLSSQEVKCGIGLHLLLGISKGERMDIAMQKAVELGVSRLSPVLTQRTVVHLQGDRLERRYLHWQQIVISACEQSGRCSLPVLDPPRYLEAALEGADGDQRLVLHHLGTATLGTVPQPLQGIALLVGPEGGLDMGEIHQAQRCGFTPLRLGPRILRTETAPLAALAAIQALWGDFTERPLS